MLGLQFSVLVSLAARLAVLSIFMEVWAAASAPRDGLPLAWLRFQLDGGHHVCDKVVTQAKDVMEAQGVTTVSTMVEVVQRLWAGVQSALDLDSSSALSVAVDEAQILAKTWYNHPEDPAVRERAYPCFCQCALLLLP